MNDKKLIEQLNKLKNIQPDSSWKKENRNILFNQISNSYVDVYKSSFQEKVKSLPAVLGNMLSKPVLAVIIVAILIGGVGIAVQPAYYSKPGDTFYFAKKITQKIRLALVLDKTEKAKMNIRFSSNHAKDITKVLSDSDFSDKKLAQELQGNFRQDLSMVKSGLRSITISDMEEAKGSAIATSEESSINSSASNIGTSGQIATSNTNKIDKQEGHSAESESQTPKGRDKQTEPNKQEGPSAQSESQTQKGQDEQTEPTSSQESVDNQSENSDNKVFSVDFEKDSQGKDIYIPEQKGSDNTVVEKEIADANQKLEKNKNKVENSTLSELYALLDQAEAEFGQENYKQARELLNKFSAKVENVTGRQAQGEVKDESEKATSTEESATSTDANATTSQTNKD